MPNSLKCRLKKLAHQGLLSENDLSRIYTDNDVITELEKIKDKIKWEANGQTGAFIKAYKVFDIIDNHISELKGENKE